MVEGRVEVNEIDAFGRELAAMPQPGEIIAKI